MLIFSINMIKYIIYDYNYFNINISLNSLSFLEIPTYHSNKYQMFTQFRLIDI